MSELMFLDQEKKNHIFTINTKLKILYWGMAGSGKTTILETLFKITKEERKDIEPTTNLTKIESPSGATLYFDMVVFHSLRFKRLNYHVYTVAGQTKFSPLRKKILNGVNGIIFVVDSQKAFLDENIKSLKELKSLTGDKLKNDIPLVIILNKRDLNEVISKEDFIEILRNEDLWYELNDPLNFLNPAIFETCALYHKKNNIYRSFFECAVRTIKYYIYRD
jgi:small GTP-binding protein